MCIIIIGKGKLMVCVCIEHMNENLHWVVTLKVHLKKKKKKKDHAMKRPRDYTEHIKFTLIFIDSSYV